MQPILSCFYATLFCFIKYKDTDKQKYKNKINLRKLAIEFQQNRQFCLSFLFSVSICVQANLCFSWRYFSEEVRFSQSYQSISGLVLRCYCKFGDP